MSGSKWGNEIRLRPCLDRRPEPRLATRGAATRGICTLASRSRSCKAAPLFSIPRIEDRDAETGEVFDIARHDREAMFETRGRDHAVGRRQADVRSADAERLERPNARQSSGLPEGRDCQTMLE